MGVHYPTLDYHTLLASTALSEATYTYQAPPVRYHKGVMIMVSNTAETGTSTLDAKVQYQHPLSLAWTDLPNATFVQWGDGSTGEKFITIYPGLTGSDADSSLALATDFKSIGLYIPRDWRLSVTVGGTSVTRTCSIAVTYLP